MSSFLEARGLWKRFGAVEAAADLYVNVRSGEIHAVIGPNGAGKTTLLRLLSGELRPDSGRIFLEGCDVSSPPTYKRARLGLGRTFQISSLFSTFTVLENVPIMCPSRSRLALQQVLRSGATRRPTRR